MYNKITSILLGRALHGSEMFILGTIKWKFPFRCAWSVHLNNWSTHGNNGVCGKLGAHTILPAPWPPNPVPQIYIHHCNRMKTICKQGNKKCFRSWCWSVAFIAAVYDFTCNSIWGPSKLQKVQISLQLNKHGSYH